MLHFPFVLAKSAFPSGRVLMIAGPQKLRCSGWPGGFFLSCAAVCCRSHCVGHRCLSPSERLFTTHGAVAGSLMLNF